MSSSELSSEESSSEEEFESIIATRERRANAGSRMRQLLALAEAGQGQDGDEEDDVDLLFQEGGDDDEFVGSDEAEEEGEGEEEEEEAEEEEEEGASRSRKRTRGSEDEDEDVNEDENFSSDTEAELSDSGEEDEGENELEAQEKEKKKRQRLKQRQIPPVIATKPAKKPSSGAAKKSERTLVEAPVRRQHSARKSTMKKTEEVRKRLEEEDKRRSHQKVVPKKEYREPTFEERMEEAKVTEERNTRSLNRYFEEEAERKQRQKDLANSRKLKLTRFVRLYSAGVYVTPNDEVAAIEAEKQRLAEIEAARQRRRRGGRKKRKVEVPEAKTEGTEGAEGPEVAKGADSVSSEVKPENEALGDMLVQKAEMAEHAEEQADNLVKEQLELEEGARERASEKLASTPETETGGKIVLQEAAFNREDAAEAVRGEVERVEQDPTAEAEEVKAEVEEAKVEKEEAETTVEATEADETLNGSGDESATAEPEVIYEGPPQFVSVDYVSFEEFQRQPNSKQVKSILLGDQSNLPANRRDPHFKTIQVIKADDEAARGLAQIKADRESSFKQLLNFPKFGEAYKFVEETKEEETVEHFKVEIDTPAPVGIYLPTGQRKKCLINGQDATYYDPNNGVPYSSVECFRVLQKVSDGFYPWKQVDNGGINSTFKGGIACYFGMRGERTAKGVPEGF